MQFQIAHRTTYTYSQPVILEPHVLRLCPRTDGSQILRQFLVLVKPQPIGMSQILDVEGNTIIKVWFGDHTTTDLEIQTTSQVQTLRQNPFDYLLEAWATKFPIDYPQSVMAHLLPYLSGNGPQYPGVDPTIAQLAHEIAHAVNNSSVGFLTALNQSIYETCTHQYRETGDPLPATLTWQQKQGSCRDLAIVFIEACRVVGLAARFVSGYQHGDPDTDDRHLHAWVEVYLPGAGWRGYDPTHGLAVADGHVAIAASSRPQSVAPVAGLFKGAGTQSQMRYTLQIQAL
jgi:transglutaminase-like putative cysteine protease